MAFGTNAIQIAVIIYAFWTCVSYSQDACDPYRGPERERCVLIPNYDDYQLAKCMINSNISSISGGTLQCNDSCRNYCWLPCMAERFGRNSGGIDPNCSCTSDTAWCNRETGSCNFFPDCMTPRYMCGNESFPSFAHYLCQLVSDTVSNDLGNCTDKEWLRDFRVCLQREIIASIFSNNTLTCTDLDTPGFAILETCFSGVCAVSSTPRMFLNSSLDASPIKQSHPSQVSNLQGSLSNCPANPPDRL